MVHPRRLKSLALLIGVLLALPASGQMAPVPWDLGSNGLGLALRRLPVAGRVLYVTAHPDDEDNAALVLLSRGRGLRTALLTLTRGDGGQNAIGPELFSALGVLRTGELQAVHRYDGVEQYFSRAYEFGFSFSKEDTIARWGYDDTLGDVVRVIRSFRPDVILTLPLEAPDHQHHTTAAFLALEGFRAAGDPGRFPEQLREGLRPWKTRRIFEGGVGGGSGAKSGGATLHTAAFDPLLGMSYAEFGAIARSMHKSQGGYASARGPASKNEPHYSLVDGDPVGADADPDILGGIDATLPSLARFAPEGAPFLKADLASIAEQIAKAAASSDPREPSRALSPLLAGLSLLRALEEKVRHADGIADPSRAEVLERLHLEEAAFLRAIPLAQGLSFLATSSAGDVPPGGSATVTLRIFNQGSGEVSIDRLGLRAPPEWEATLDTSSPHVLRPGDGVVLRGRVKVGDNARVTGPYWHRVDSKDRLAIDVPAAETLPWTPPDLVASAAYTLGGVSLSLETPVLYSFVASPQVGEREKTFNVVPRISVRLTPEEAVLPAGSRRVRDFVVRVRASAGAHVEARLEVPGGWSVTPPKAPLQFASDGEELAATFQVEAPISATPGSFEVKAVGSDGTSESRTGYDTISYPHVEERHLSFPAVARVRLLDVRVQPGVRLGYVAGVGDLVPAALAQMGAPVRQLSEDDLAASDLSGFTSIVLGIRAYSKPWVRSYNRRLLDYVEKGGNLVVQYNRAEFNGASTETSPFSPYPALVTSKRITDAKAPLTILVPESPVFRSPNTIVASDFEGWVQERGIQFLEAKDPRYIDLLAGSDPYPLNAGVKRGILVVAKVGKGTWTYVGLGLFRQIQAGTAGAYRILANLVSRPRTP